MRYIAEYADQLALSTLKQRLAALANWHQSNGFPDPTKAPKVRQLLKGIRAVHPVQQRQAAPLALLHLEKAVAHLESEVDQARAAIPHDAMTPRHVFSLPLLISLDGVGVHQCFVREL
ncbi:hypothetical protein [Pseudomonas putida]